jgi:2-oxoglutarate/2-oxoacid ferredoxin oxidoreductase subunit alpha
VNGVLMEGGPAIAESAIRAGCRFYAGYPITPSTEILEYMSRRLPEVGGVCMNAESEIEGISMVWGAAATGARAMIASTGQGISLMQESFSEMATARIPFVPVNMSRGQGDYFQSTRGGGHGDYRFIVLSPASVQEAADLASLAFDLAEKWRKPAMILGDFLLDHIVEAVVFKDVDLSKLTPKPWAITGAAGRASQNLGPLGTGKVANLEEAAQTGVSAHPDIAREEPRFEERWCEDADVVVCAFGMPSRFVRFAVKKARQAGKRFGFFRPISLWPFPEEGLRNAASRATKVMVFELNNGQMIDDVRLTLNGSVQTEFIGGISSDSSGFGVGDLLDVRTIGDRIETAA